MNIKEYLEYYPATGIFRWLKSPQGRVKEGDEAGTINNRGYVKIGFNRKSYAAHRLAWFYMYGDWPEHEIDHINGVNDDNRIKNLRDVTHPVNNKNAKKYITNTSGYPGIYRHYGKWAVQIGGRKTREFLGVFELWWDAVCVKKAAEWHREYHKNHGEEANNRAMDRSHT